MFSWFKTFTVSCFPQRTIFSVVFSLPSPVHMQLPSLLILILLHFNPSFCTPCIFQIFILFYSFKIFKQLLVPSKFFPPANDLNPALYYLEGFGVHETSFDLLKLESFMLSSTNYCSDLHLWFDLVGRNLWKARFILLHCT